MTYKVHPETQEEVEFKNMSDELAAITMSPMVQAATTLQQWQGSVERMAYYDALATQMDKVNDGDMRRPESMLFSQAIVLEALFNDLARKARIQEHMPHYETFLRLALKAQTQCWATLETLATIKNPSVIYARQTNISSGHQQINNGVPVPATHAEKIKNPPNELLTELPHETLDSGRTSATIEINQEMATVE